MAFSSEKEATELKRLFSIHPEDPSNKIEVVKELFKSSGAAKATQDAIHDFTFLAFQTLDKMKISADKKEMLRNFGENLMGRKV